MFGIKKKMQSDREADLIQLICDHQHQLYRIAYSYVKNEQDALDVIQEATYKAIVHQDKLKEPSYMKSWLIRILINCALDVCRKKEIVSEAPELWSDSGGESGITSEAIIDLKDAIRSLNETQKKLIHLKYFEDLKLEDISQILEMPLGTVKSQLHRALKQLKIELKEVEAFE